MQPDSEREASEVPPGEAPDPSALFDALGDETSREILYLTNRKHSTVEDLADDCEVPEEIVDRRISRLGELGLVESLPWPNRSDGHAYTGAVDTLRLRLQEERLELRFDDRGGLSEAVCTIEEMLEIECATFDRDSSTVELRATATDELFDILLKYYQH